MTVREGIAQIFQRISDMRGSRNEKIEALRRDANTFPFWTILKGAFDPSIKFRLPTGPTPFKKSEFDEPNMIYTEARRIYLFVEGMGPAMVDMTPAQRKLKVEAWWIDLLQSVNPSDAIMLDKMKDKTLPWSNINAALVNDAYPGLLSAMPEKVEPVKRLVKRKKDDEQVASA